MSRPSAFERNMAYISRLYKQGFTDTEASAIMRVKDRTGPAGWMTLGPLLSAGTALDVAKGMSRIAGAPKKGKAAEDKAVLVAAVARLTGSPPCAS